MLTEDCDKPPYALPYTALVEQRKGEEATLSPELLRIRSAEPGREEIEVAATALAALAIDGRHFID